jgi:hypothetical protein
MSGLTREQSGALLKWLKAEALETAAELRDDGWTEDARGLWNKGKHKRLHLFDAAEVAMQAETCDNSNAARAAREEA